MPSVPELLIILAIVVLLFGAKKIPDLAKGLGSGIKNFKKAVKDDEDEDNATHTTATKETEVKPQTIQNQQEIKEKSKIKEVKEV